MTTPANSPKRPIRKVSSVARAAISTEPDSSRATRHTSASAKKASSACKTTSDRNGFPRTHSACFAVGPLVSGLGGRRHRMACLGSDRAPHYAADQGRRHTPWQELQSQPAKPAQHPRRDYGLAGEIALDRGAGHGLGREPGEEAAT